MEADGDLAWEMSIKRYDALVKACEAAHNHRKWWLCHTERYGPSKWFGVVLDGPSWRAYITIDGVKLHLGTCKCEDGAGLAADFARVAMGLAPKNFTAPWDSIKAWVEAGANGVVPAVVVPVALRCEFKVNGAASVDASDASEAASSPEAKIKDAIAKKPDVAAESAAMVLHTTKQVNDLGAVDIKTIADLARASVDEEKYVRAVSTAKKMSDARAFFWKLKGAAAKRLDVDIGALPAKQRAAKQRAANKTSTKERPKAHQDVRDGVANCSMRWLSG